ncbi:uncharacterized protein Z518_09140 [Rhinocladiella mackenziei CBS 650.93]|uniref:Rhinocladiella mackenziei CBS 650.93 unplaced genomic scaffold supercont1.7, whole genome shotgun sequence n=1 Tax=Rhinocladiella mackenziei CBS 650.93 TaxID=1442369 RepID=A0A0D2I6I2_9EURO|nr:uncharacterized protein Z518_09140 [Rhinocladiella mackenziei CBS 650.93]KIX01414.1 hypothetical protein Z518_09140 [Rhinocladiella mackenziei CBS 650.93]
MPPPNSQRPRTGRRWNTSTLGTLRPLMLSLMIILTSMVATTYAHDMEFDALIYESSFFRELAERGEIHVDARPPPSPPTRRDVYFERRQEDNSAVPTIVAEPTSISSTSIDSPSSSTIETEAPQPATAVSTATTPSVTVVTTPLPSPFDTSLGSNFTSPSCPQYFSTFLGNSTFQSCVPISLMLQNSNSFFRAERSTTLLAQTFDAACNAPLAICSPLLASIASDLIDDSNCGEDFRQQNPLVTQAYAGLTAYEPIYRATCLRDADTGSYCFIEAITNTSNPADPYPYYTALGMQMPTAAHPTCSQCLKDTMDIFAGYAEISGQPLAKTYIPCASQVDATCGTNFAATNVEVGSISSPNVGASLFPSASSVIVLLVGLWLAFY